MVTTRRRPDQPFIVKRVALDLNLSDSMPLFVVLLHEQSVIGLVDHLMVLPYLTLHCVCNILEYMIPAVYH